VIQKPVTENKKSVFKWYWSLSKESPAFRIQYPIPHRTKSPGLLPVALRAFRSQCTGVRSADTEMALSRCCRKWKKPFNMQYRSPPNFSLKVRNQTFKRSKTALAKHVVLKNTVNVTIRNLRHVPYERINTVITSSQACVMKFCNSFRSTLYYEQGKMGHEFELWQNLTVPIFVLFQKHSRFYVLSSNINTNEG